MNMNKGEKSNRNSNTRGCSILSMLFIFVAVLSLSGCGEKQICDYCLEEKHCEEYNILGTIRYICDECLNNPARCISGNVLLSYESELVDPSLYIVSINTVEEAPVVSGNSTEFVPISSDVAENFSVSDNAPESIPSQPEVTESVPEAAPADTQSTTLTSNANVNINSQGKDAVIGNIQDQLSSQGYYLKANDDNDTPFTLYNGNTATSITFDFTGSNNTTTKLTASMAAGGSDVDFLNTCICSALGFLGSSDYYGEGADIYNNIVDHGNYSYNGCKFYYIESSDNEISEGGPVVRFQASFQ